MRIRKNKKWSQQDHTQPRIEDGNYDTTGRYGGLYGISRYVPGPTLSTTYENTLANIYNRSSAGDLDDVNGSVGVLFYGNTWIRLIGDTFIRDYSMYITNKNYTWLTHTTNLSPKEIYESGIDNTAVIDTVTQNGLSSEQIQIIFLNFDTPKHEDGFAATDADITTIANHYESIITQLESIFMNLQHVYYITNPGYYEHINSKNTFGDYPQVQQAVAQTLCERLETGTHTWTRVCIYPINTFIGGTKKYISRGWKGNRHEYTESPISERSIAEKIAMYLYCTLLNEDLPKRTFADSDQDFTARYVLSYLTNDNLDTYTSGLIIPIQQTLEATPRTYAPSDRPPRVLWVDFNNPEPNETDPPTVIPATEFDNVSGTLRTYWREQYTWQYSLDNLKTRQARIIEYAYNPNNDEYRSDNGPWGDANGNVNYTWSTASEWYYVGGRGSCVGVFSFHNTGDWTNLGVTIPCGDIGWGYYGKFSAPALTPHTSLNAFYEYECGNPNTYLTDFGADMYVELDWAFMTEWDMTPKPAEDVIYLVITVSEPDANRGSGLPHEYPTSVTGHGTTWSLYTAFEASFNNGANNRLVALWIPDNTPSTEDPIVVDFGTGKTQEYCYIEAITIKGDFTLPNPSNISWGTFDSGSLQNLTFNTATKNNLFLLFQNSNKEIDNRNNVSPWTYLNKTKRNSLYMFKCLEETSGISIDMSGTAEVTWFNLPLQTLDTAKIGVTHIEEDFSIDANPPGTTYNDIIFEKNDTDFPLDVFKIQSGWLIAQGENGLLTVRSSISRERSLGESFYTRLKGLGNGQIVIGMSIDDVITVNRNGVTDYGVLTKEHRDLEIAIVARSKGFLIYVQKPEYGRWALEYVTTRSTQSTLQPYVTLHDINNHGLELDRIAFVKIKAPFNKEESISVSVGDTQTKHPTNFLANFVNVDDTAWTFRYHDNGTSWYEIRTDGLYYYDGATESILYDGGIPYGTQYDVTVKVANGIHELYVNGIPYYRIEKFDGLGSIQPQLHIAGNVENVTIWSYIPNCLVQDALELLANR